MAQTVTLVGTTNALCSASFTASGTPTVSNGQWAYVHTRNNSDGVSAEAPTLALSGVSWTRAASWAYDNSGAGQYRLDLLYATGTPSGSILYTTYSSSLQVCQVHWFETTETSTTVTQYVTAPAAANTSDASVSATMSALSSSNAVVVAVGIETNDTITPEAGWTSLTSSNQGNGSMGTFYRIDGSDTTPAASGWISTIHGMLAAELASSAGGSATSAQHFFLRGVA